MSLTGAGEYIGVLVAILMRACCACGVRVKLWNESAGRDPHLEELGDAAQLLAYSITSEVNHGRLALQQLD
jgi:hypothetical protein